MVLARNVIAFLLGLAIGSAVNMGLIMIGHQVIALPAGADVSNMENLAASMHLFGPKHFLFPFLAHALGTLTGAALAYVIAATYKFRIGMGIGGAFLAGGIINSVMLPAPAWFIPVDLLFAYLPMAWIGVRLGMRLPAGDANSH